MDLVEPLIIINVDALRAWLVINNNHAVLSSQGLEVSELLGELLEDFVEYQCWS